MQKNLEHDPEKWNPVPAFAKPASAGEGRSDKIMPRKVEERREGSPRDLACHDAMNFPARGCADRLVVEQQLG